MQVQRAAVQVSLVVAINTLRVMRLAGHTSDWSPATLGSASTPARAPAVLQAALPERRLEVQIADPPIKRGTVDAISIANQA
jgi:hypothetical protein